MNIYISYFYQIRFFTPSLVPLSTAAFDPKWFHDNQGDKYIYKDKRGVYNGLKIKSLIPQTGGECPCTKKNPMTCSFMCQYKRQLDSLNFNEILDYCQRISDRVKILNNMNINPDIVLIVFETPNNPCSERRALQQWFKEHNYILKEWNKEEK